MNCRVGSLLLLALIAGLPPISYASASHSVYLTTNGRILVLTGNIEATVVKGSTIVNGVTIEPGDTIKVIADSVREGRIRIGNNGYLNTLLYDNATLIVNGRVVVSDSRLRLRGIYIDASNVVSTLTVTVNPEPEGYTRLVIDGSTVISGVDSSSISLQGLRPSSTQYLSINLGSGYVRGVASEVVVNGHTVPMVTLTGLAVALLIVSAAVTVWIARRKN